MPRALAEALVGQVAAAGIDTLFGLPGGGPNLEMVGAAHAQGLRFVLAHGETAACIMASTYGLLTGHPGVCITTRGPGIASAVNGAAQATLDRSPLLLVSDSVPSDQAARISHQRFDQVAVLGPVTKWSGTLGTSRPAEVVAGSLALAASAPAGAVHLDFDPSSAGDAPPPQPRATAGADEDTLGAALRLVTASRKPILLVGAEAIPWTQAVRELAQAVGCPCLVTYQAKGVIPDAWPSAAGLFTNGALERALAEEADLILAVGLDPVEPIPAPWHYAAPIIAVHPWELVDRYYSPAVELIGAPNDALAALQPHLHSDWDPGAGAAAKERAARALAVELPGLTPQQVVDALHDCAPPATTVTVDAGAHMLVVLPRWPVAEPRELLISNGLATMGFAVPAAIAAALARPGRPVLCLVGDGGLGMTLAELETIARLRLHVTVVVFNDASLSLIEIKQTPDQGDRKAVRYGLTDFALCARGLGLPASVASDERALRQQLLAGWDRPRLIDARINPAGYGHVLRATRG